MGSIKWKIQSRKHLFYLSAHLGKPLFYTWTPVAFNVFLQDSQRFMHKKTIWKSIIWKQMPAPMDKLMLNDHSTTRNACSRAAPVPGRSAIRMAVGRRLWPSPGHSAAVSSRPAQLLPRAPPSLQEPPAAPSGRTGAHSSTNLSWHQCSTCKAVCSEHCSPASAAHCLPALEPQGLSTSRVCSSQ